jgi:hypothetical protein
MDHVVARASALARPGAPCCSRRRVRPWTCSPTTPRGDARRGRTVMATDATTCRAHARHRSGRPRADAALTARLLPPRARLGRSAAGARAGDGVLRVQRVLAALPRLVVLHHRAAGGVSCRVAVGLAASGCHRGRRLGLPCQVSVALFVLTYVPARSLPVATRTDRVRRSLPSNLGAGQPFSGVGAAVFAGKASCCGSGDI